MRPAPAPQRLPTRGRRALVVVALCVGAVLLVLLLRGRAMRSPDAPVAGAPSPATSRPSRAAEPPSEPPGQATDAAPEPARPATASSLAPFGGQVVSARGGAPVPGAEVTFGASRGAASVTTDGEGRFRWVPPGPGDYQLAAVLAPGFVPFGPEWGQSPIRLAAPVPAGTPDLRIQLEPEKTFGGRVTAADGGAPIAGATVELRPWGAPGGLAPAERRFTTGADGRFRGSGDRTAALVARAAGFLPAAAAVDDEVTFALERAGADAAGEVRGRVVDERGGGVPGASVSARVRGRGAWGWAVGPPAVDADASGRFVLSGVPEGGAMLEARAGELVSERVSAQPGAIDVTLTVRAGGVLAGRVLRANGRPAEAFALRVWRLRRSEPPQTLSVVDAGGRWEVRGLGAGVYLLQAAAAGAGPSEQVRVELPAGPDARVERDLTLRPGHGLSGVVRDSATREPIAGAELAVEASPAEDSVLVRATGVSDAAGRFTLDGLPDTPVTVTVEAEGHHRKLVSVGQGRGVLEILLRPVAQGGHPGTDLVGIGAQVSRADDGIELGTVVGGGGAAQAGLGAGDVITRIDGQTVAELGFSEAVQRLRGDEGSTVRLEVRRADGSTVRIEVTRRPVTY